MIAALLLIASLSHAQSTGTAVNFQAEQRIKNMATDIRDFQSGRPTLTGLPTFQGGATMTGPLTASGSASFSGSTSFSAKATFAAGSTFTVLGIGNVWVFVSSQDVVNVTTVTFSGISSSTSYRVDFIAYSTNAVNYVLGFNGGWSANTDVSGIAWASAGVGAYGTTNLFGMVLNDDNAQTVSANTSIKGVADFETIWGSSVSIRIIASSAHKSTTGAIRTIGSEGRGFVSLADPPSSLQITTTGTVASSFPTFLGPLSGHFELWSKGFSHQ